MASSPPLITFKAGLCTLSSTKPYTVKCEQEKGYIYLYAEEDLIHFCWRPRAQSIDDEPPMDLVMVPGDGRFVPYEHTTMDQASARTNGRIFVLKFGSSSQRYLFWLQSAPQLSPSRSTTTTLPDPSYLSPRDRKIGDVVDRILQGEEVDPAAETAAVQSANGNGGGGNGGNRGGGDDEDETMEDVEGHGGPHEHHQGGGGGAGPDATGGDVRKEGQDSREGGADGARAASGGVPDAATVVQNFLNSLKGSSSISGGASSSLAAAAGGKVFPGLNDLLDPSFTTPVVDSFLDEDEIDQLIASLPTTIVTLWAGGPDFASSYDDLDDAEALAMRSGMKLEQKKELLRHVLRSPQFHQSLAGITTALRDGGLPTVAGALGVQVANNGLVKGGSMPMGGGAAVEAYLDGVKKAVKDELGM